MAGMDWFRWHHGSVNDPKFALVARKAGASVPDVLAVWAYILETASQSVERGDFGFVDCEALDCVFGFPPAETRTEDILMAMAGRELTNGTRIASWEKRQVRREREDATNANRQATFKANKNQVTPDNAVVNQKTPRVEESRVEENTKEEERAQASPAFVLPEWIPEDTWAAYCKVRTGKKAKNEPHALGLIVKDLEKFRQVGHDPITVLNNSIKSGWAGVFEPKTLATFAQVKADVSKTTVSSNPDVEATRLRVEADASIPRNGPTLAVLERMAAIRVQRQAA